MKDKFIKVEDMYQNPMIYRESSIKSADQSREYTTITFADGHKFQVKTKVDDIWKQLSQNNK